MEKSNPYTHARYKSVFIPIYRNADGSFIGSYTLPGEKRKHVKLKDVEELKERLEKVAKSIYEGKTEHVDLSSEQAASYRRACEIVAKTGLSVERVCRLYVDAVGCLPSDVPLIDAARFWASKNRIRVEPKTIADLIEPFIAEKESKKQLSAIWVRDLRARLTCAGEALKSPIGELTCDDFEDFLAKLMREDGGKVSPLTRSHHRQALINFFKSKTARRYLPAGWNETANIERPNIPDRDVDFYSVEEITTLLYAAEGLIELPTDRAKAIAAENGKTLTAPTPEQKEGLRKLVPHLAIGFFGSTRNCIVSGEISRLDWSRVDFKEGYIRMTGDVVRKTSRRFPKINDALRHWLLPHAREVGEIIPPNARKLRDLLCLLTGIKWKANGMRKTCLTYHRALSGDSEAVAENAGNSARLVKKTYTEPVSKELGQSWAAIRRPESEKIVNLNERTA